MIHKRASTSCYTYIACLVLSLFLHDKTFYTSSCIVERYMFVQLVRFSNTLLCQWTQYGSDHDWTLTPGVRLHSSAQSRDDIIKKYILVMVLEMTRLTQYSRPNPQHFYLWFPQTTLQLIRWYILHTYRALLKSKFYQTFTSENWNFLNDILLYVGKARGCSTDWRINVALPLCSFIKTTAIWCNYLYQTLTRALTDQVVENCNIT